LNPGDTVTVEVIGEGCHHGAVISYGELVAAVIGVIGGHTAGHFLYPVVCIIKGVGCGGGCSPTDGNDLLSQTVDVVVGIGDGSITQTPAGVILLDFVYVSGQIVPLGVAGEQSGSACFGFYEGNTVEGIQSLGGDIAVGQGSEPVRPSVKAQKPLLF